jgi:tetratricopeptide (TPR) repeat protein
MNKKYLIKLKDRSIKGPIQREEIEDMIYDGILTGEELIKEYPEGEWVEISKEKHFYDVFIGAFELEQQIGLNKKNTVVDFKTNPNKQKTNISNKTKLTKTGSKTKTGKTEIYTPEESKKISNLVVFKKSKAVLKPEEKSPIIPNAAIGREEIEKQSNLKNIIFITIGIALTLIVLFLYFFQEKSLQTISIEGADVEKTSIEMILPVAESEEYDPAKSKELRLQGINLLYKDNINSYKASLDLFLEAFKLNISNKNLLSYIAFCYAKLYNISKRNNEYLNGLKAIITRAERGIKNSQILALAQVSYFNLIKNYQASISIFNKILANTEDLSKINILLLTLAAETSYLSKDISSSNKIIDQIKEIYQNKYSRVHYLEGLIRKNDKKEELAISSFKKALEINPFHSESKVELLLTSKSTTLPELLNYIKTNSANTNHKDISRLLYLVANTLVSEKDLLKAKKFYKKALDFYPNNTEAIVAYEQIGGNIEKYKNKMLSDPSENKDASVFLMRGDELFNIQKYRDASLQYRMATSLMPDDQASWYKLGESYRKTYEYKKAIDAYKKSLKINNLNINTLIKLSRVQTQLYMFQDASKNITKAMETDPENPDTLYTIGIFNEKRNLLKEAINYYHKAITKDFSHVESMFKLGKLNYSYKKYEDARLLFDKVINAKPDKFESYIYKTRIISRLHDIQRAERYVEHLQKTFPNVAEIDVALALAYFDRSFFTKAENRLKKALQKNKYSIPALEAMAKLSEKIGRFKEALEYLETIVIIAPYYLKALNKKIQIYKELDQIGNYEKELVRLVTVAPYYPKAFYRLGLLYFENNRLVDAQKAVKEEIYHNPKIQDSYLLLGEIYLKSNKTDKALTLYRKMLNQNPKSVHGLVGMAKAFYTAKDFSSALSFITQAKQVDPSVSDIYYVECLVYYHINMFEESREACRTYIEKEPNNKKSLKANEIMSKI